MGSKLQHFTALIKHGTVYLEKSLLRMKNVKPIPWDFICLCLKMFNRFSCQTSQSSKDGTLFGSNGSILSSAALKDSFIMMLMEKNGSKLTSVPLMPS